MVVKIVLLAALLGCSCARQVCWRKPIAGLRMCIDYRDGFCQRFTCDDKVCLYDEPRWSCDGSFSDSWREADERVVGSMVRPCVLDADEMAEVYRFPAQCKGQP